MKAILRLLPRGDCCHSSTVGAASLVIAWTLTRL